MAIHSNRQTVLSLSHLVGITLGVSEEVDEVAGGASGMCVDRKGEVGDRQSYNRCMLSCDKLVHSYVTVPQ